MKLIVRELGISTGGPLVAVINEEDADTLDLHPLDRIKLFKGKKLETVVVDIANDCSSIPQGSIGLMNDLAQSMKLKEGDLVNISIAKKPLSLDYIKKKLDGYSLTKEEIDQVVWDIVHNKLSEIELTFFVSACYCNPNTMDETVWLTQAIAHEGHILKLNKNIIMDKHSIGGIPGNRTTMVVVPIIAAMGYTIPKTSSRAITSPAGTADTMEVLAKVAFSLSRMKAAIKKCNACIVWGGALDLAPADDKIINIEKTLMIDAESQLLASIMAKKHSVSSTHVIIDIPIGPHTKITERRKAEHLRRKFHALGKKLGMKIRVILTDGRQPIGNGIGPALEARDVLRVLRQEKDMPMDLENKSIQIAAELFNMVGIKDGKKLARYALRSGKAYEKMREIIKLQQGNPNIKPEDITLDRFKYDMTAERNGRIESINNLMFAKLARIAGAPKNKGAGIYLYKHIGDSVSKGERIFTVYAGTKNKIEYAKDLLKSTDDIVEY